MIYKRIKGNKNLRIKIKNDKIICHCGPSNIISCSWLVYVWNSCKFYRLQYCEHIVELV